MINEWEEKKVRISHGRGIWKCIMRTLEAFREGISFRVRGWEESEVLGG